MLLYDSSRSLHSENGDNVAIAATDKSLKSQTLIARSETVLGKALETVNSNFGQGGNRQEQFRRAQNALRVKMEPETNLLIVSFRDADPSVAARVADQVAENLVDLDTKIKSNPFAADFFTARVREYKKKLKEDSRQLEDYAIANNVYLIAEQKRLNLGRREKIVEELAGTRETIGRLDSQLQSLRVQLGSLKSRMTLPKEIFGELAFARADRPAFSADVASDPPLLHVKLYQDSAQLLVNMNVELSGRKSVEADQFKALQQVDEQLRGLTRQDAQYSSLEAEVAQDRDAVALYTRKAAEAEIESAWRANQRFATLRLFQRSEPPETPVFPRPILIFPLCVLGGLAVSAFLVLLLEAIRSATTRRRHSDFENYPAPESGRPAPAHI